MRVLIVGAGPTGLTAGVELARRGIQAEIIDRRAEASTLSRAVGINPRSLEILEPSGVTSKLLERGIQYRAIRIYRNTKPLPPLPLTAAPVEHGYNFVLGLSQDETEEVLSGTFTDLGGVIHYGTELTGLRQNDRQVIAETASGEELACDYLLGADGTRSATRETLGIPFEGFDIAEKWSIADVDADGWPHPDALTLCQLPKGGVAAVAPLGAGRYRVISNIGAPLQALPLELRVTRIRREGRFTISIRQVSEYTKGRVSLAGDAAHCHSPVGGRGMNLGMDDSADFAARLAEGDLSSYSQDRHAKGSSTIAGSELMRKILTSPNPITRTLLAAGLRTAAFLPPFRRRIASRFLYG